MLHDFRANYTLYEMHVLRITLAQEMADFRHFTQYLFVCKLYLQHGGVL